mmetsp:Transcript_16067/g.24293  ORF Transcript_16067/g.24293 Transcript_16067/m.24293 type:complete len:84 (+) Transcript_16067:345-596(+)
MFAIRPAKLGRDALHYDSKEDFVLVLLFFENRYIGNLQPSNDTPLVETLQQNGLKLRLFTIVPACVSLRTVKKRKPSKELTDD